MNLKVNVAAIHRHGSSCERHSSNGKLFAYSQWHGIQCQVRVTKTHSTVSNLPLWAVTSWVQLDRKLFLRTLERTLLPCTCELQSFKFSQSIPKATSQENYLPLLLFICSNKVQIKQEIKTIYAEMVWNRLRASVLQYAVSQTRMGHGIYVRGMAHEVNQIIVITRRCRRMFAYAMYGPVWIVCQ